MKNSVRNNKGFSLAEVLVASAIVAGIGVSVVNLGLLGGKDKVSQNLSRAANRARQNIEGALKNPTAWDLTVAYGANSQQFDCFNPSKKNEISVNGCVRNAGDPEGYYSFVVLSPSNKKLSYEDKDLTTRIPLNSEKCDASVPGESEKCPLRYLAKWRPICTTYPCHNAQIEVQLTLINDFPTLAPFNPNLYSFKLIRNYADTSVPDACRLLNGVYNVKTGKCTPKYTNKACSSPYQVVTAVDGDGEITCSPLYSGTCSAPNPMVMGFSISGQVICGPQPAASSSCPINCEGNWGACDKNIPEYGQPHPFIMPYFIAGKKTYTVTQPASNGGAACPNATGDTDFCISLDAPPLNCIGSWGACSATCDGGTQIFTITQQPDKGGDSCTNNDGDSRDCNTQACGVKVDCAGGWGACDKSTGLQIFTITTPSQNGGAACSAADGATQACAVNCEGSWGACTGTPPSAYKLFTVNVTPKNGGLACAYVNGATDPSDCNSSPPPPPTNCVGYWGTCNSSTELETYTIATPAANGGAACSAANGQTRACVAVCSQSYCHLNKTYTCNRFSNGNSERFGPFGSCIEDENSGVNPCTQPLCVVDTTTCCDSGWGVDASAGMCVVDAVLNNGQYTCPSGGNLAIDGTKCAKVANCN